MQNNSEYGPEAFAEEFSISRETLSRVKCYVDLLAQWQDKMNLIGPNTLPHVWSRHILDSAQLLNCLPAHVSRETTTWVDLGTGAGLPGVVLALLGVKKVHLVDSSAKRCAFLRNVVRKLELPAEVHCSRIEDLESIPADYVTSRALAATSKLVTYAQPFLKETGEILLLKGQDVEDELTQTAISRNMSIERYPSRTDPRGVILRITGAHYGPN